MPAGGQGFARPVPPGGYHWWYADAISDCGRFAFTVIAFVGSVFSPYYHWSGRRRPENHIAFNIALYAPGRNFWAMTERSVTSLTRNAKRLTIGDSSMEMADGRLSIRFNETALPWPGQRAWPTPISGSIDIMSEGVCGEVFPLDETGHHFWSPRMAKASASIACSALPGGGWRGRAYHDLNFGDRPVEEDFIGWDWARGSGSHDDDTVILYDALLRGGGRKRLALQTGGHELRRIGMPHRRNLPRGFWGVRCGVPCDDDRSAVITRRLEDSPFYTRSIVETVVNGRTLHMVHETLDCVRLGNPLVRLMLPFRMPRRPGR
ncbi:carotenoid 1,2-hydratase [Ciceribacter sp. L1K23]|uniref:carotenoid 1,2-hydratase n=1 Tax=Ciceribacter sp. L1K23 TaxID=2820276 RepID=UPI0032C20F99